MPGDVIGFHSRLDMRTQFSHIDCHSVHPELLTIAQDLCDFHSRRFNACGGPMVGKLEFEGGFNFHAPEAVRQVLLARPLVIFWYVCTNTRMFTCIY